MTEETKEGKTMQVYTGDMRNFSTYTPDGLRIVFNEFKHITDSPKVIEFLDGEILNKTASWTKGEPIQSFVGDPMEELEKKFREKFEAEQKQRAIDIAMGQGSRDMGTTEDAPKVNAASTAAMLRQKLHTQAAAPKAEE